MNREGFYNRIRNSLFEGELSQTQVNNINAILDEWHSRGLTDIRQLAYILGTVYHETAKTMAPIEEYGKGKGKKYGERKTYTGLPYKEEAIYFGRGHTQNTWWDNYKALTKSNPMGWNFLEKPELLLEREPSIWATFHAMLTGLYTGKRLQHYFNASTCDWYNARRIINGTDCADLIARHAKIFWLALR